jgi:lipoprotein-anchoring transpeptidase ErfK/SrfK
MRRSLQEGPNGKTRILSTEGCLSLAAMLLLAAVAAQAQTAPALPLQPSENARFEPVRRIVVSIPDRMLALLENNRVVKIYRVAVGAPESPSPAGEFRIVQRLTDPTYYAPGVVIPSGPENPLGPRWLGLSLKSFGIHGTNQPRSIGRSASHGCIRMRNRDVKELFAWVRAGDAVELHGQRDAEVARVFGGAATLTVARAAAQESQAAAGIEASVTNR